MNAPKNDASPPEVILAPLTLWDAPKFLQLKKELEGETRHLSARRGERKESLLFTIAKMLLYRKRVFTFVAKENGKYVGYITVIFAKFKKFRGNAYISTVSVKETHQNRGIGTRLLALVEDFAKNEKKRRLELEVFAENEKAIQLYERLGFIKEGQRRNAVETRNGFDDIVFMTKFLS